MEQYADLLHFDEDFLIKNLREYIKFVCISEKSKYPHQNGASLHTAPSNDFIHQT